MRANAGVWGGRTAVERRDERRARLIEAATEIWAENGWAAVTMRGVCAQTSLNDRYFYEHFTDRDDLLGAVWDGIRDGLIDDLLAVIAEDPNRAPAETLRTAISVVVDRASSDPGWAQIMVAHHVGNAVLEQRRTAVLHQMTDILVAAAQPYLRADVDETGLRMDALVGIGGFAELITAWQSGLVDVDAQHIIDHTSRLGVTLAAAYLASDDDRNAGNDPR